MRAKYKAKREANIDEWRARELARSQKYYASKDGFIPSPILETLLAEQGGACYLCTAPLDPNHLNVDHKTPVSQAAQTTKQTSPGLRHLQQGEARQDGRAIQAK